MEKLSDYLKVAEAAAFGRFRKHGQVVGGPREARGHAIANGIPAVSRTGSSSVSGGDREAVQQERKGEVNWVAVPMSVRPT